MAIRDISIVRVATISRDSSIMDAVSLMKKRNVGSLIVSDKSNGLCRPKGIITDRDIALCLADCGQDPRTLFVRDIMSANLVTANQYDGILDVIRAMRQSKINRIPIVDSRGFLVGVISSDDILKLIASELADLAGVRKFSRPNSRASKSSPRNKSVNSLLESLRMAAREYE